jgi:hypothetical protein
MSFYDSGDQAPSELWRALTALWVIVLILMALAIPVMLIAALVT